MPNTLTSIFVSNPATEPVEAPHPNTGVYVTGTQATAGGPWTVVHTLITKTATPLTMVGRLKNFPAVTVSVVASGGPNAGNIFNNILATPTGTAATGTSSTAINVAVSSIANQTGYRLLASNASTGPFTQIYQGTTASFPHTGLTASQTQYYQWQYVGGGYYDDSPVSAVFSGASTAAAVLLYQVLVDGDSEEGQGYGNSMLASGSLSADFAGDPTATGEFGGLTGFRWSIDLKNLLSSSYGDFRNYGKSGSTVAGMLSRYQANLIPLRAAATYPTRQIIYMGGGINDFILAGNRTPALVYADKKTMIAAYHTAGFKVICSTLTPTSFVPAARTNADVMADVNTYNGLMRNGQADLGYDGLVDWNADSILSNLTGGSYRDGLHMTDAGNSRKATVALPVFQAVATTGTQTFVQPPNVYEQTNALINYAQAWTTATNTGYDSAGSAAYLSSADGAAGFTFTGTQFSLGTGQYGLTMKYDVEIDGVVAATVTTTGATTACVDRYQSAVLAAGVHTVRILGRASYAAYAWLDRITITGTLQAYAAPVAAVNVYQEDNALIYTGGPAWTVGANTNFDSLDKSLYLSSADGFKAFSFTGTGFALGTVLFGFSIKYDVFVDDVKMTTVITTGSPNQVCTDRYTLAGLTNAVHSVKVVGRASYASYAWLDRITVTGALQAYAGTTTMPA